jgi:hypothetical protein
LREYGWKYRKSGNKYVDNALAEHNETVISQDIADSNIEFSYQTELPRPVAERFALYLGEHGQIN